MPKPIPERDPVRDLFLLTHRAIEEEITPDFGDPHILFHLAYIAHETGLKTFPIPKKIGQQFLEFLQRTVPEIAGTKPVSIRPTLQRAFDHGTLRETYVQQLEDFHLLASQEDDHTQMIALLVKSPLKSIDGLVDSLSGVSDKILAAASNSLAEKFGQVVQIAIARGIRIWDYQSMAKIIEELRFLNAPCCNGQDPACGYQQALLTLRQKEADALDFEGPLLVISQLGTIYLFGPANAEGRRILHQAEAESHEVVLLGSGNEATWPTAIYPKRIILGQCLFIDDKRLDSLPVFSGVIVRAQQDVVKPQQTQS